MAYQLKDKDLQQRLDEISFGAFSEELAARTGDLDRLYNDSHVESVRICFNRKGLLRGTLSGERFSVLLTAENIEKTVDFKDGTWNNYPEVTPPTRVLMRVETKSGGRFCASYRTFSDGECWCHADGRIMPEALSSAVIRFRSWED